MYNNCKRVPDIIELSVYDGNYDRYEQAVYDVYRNSIEAMKFTFEGKPIVHKKYPITNGKPGTFWHIVSSGNIEEQRIPDIRRYERIAWPAFILDYCNRHCQDIRIWKNQRKGKKRVILWCNEIEYVVILDERKDFFVFWTAYPITRDHTRRKLLREYAAYKSKSAL